MALKDNIRIARLQKGLTQEELGTKIGVKKQTIQKYENGIITNVPSDKVEAIAIALETTPAYLMDWEDDAQNNPAAAKLNSIETALWEEFKAMTEEQKEDVLKLIRFLKDQGKL